MDPVTRSGGPVGAPAWLHRMRVMWSQRQRVMGAQLCKRGATRESDCCLSVRFPRCWWLFFIDHCINVLRENGYAFKVVTDFTDTPTSSVPYCSVLRAWWRGGFSDRPAQVSCEIFWLLLQFPLEHLLEYVWLLLC